MKVREKRSVSTHTQREMADKVILMIMMLMMMMIMVMMIMMIMISIIIIIIVMINFMIRYHRPSTVSLTAAVTTKGFDQILGGDLPMLRCDFDHPEYGNDNDDNHVYDGDDHVDDDHYIFSKVYIFIRWGQLRIMMMAKIMTITMMMMTMIIIISR